MYYTRRLIRTAETRAKIFPELGRPQWPRRMSLRLFDEVYTAPQAGFANARAYYEYASAKPYLPTIKVPTTILAAADDPVCPISAFRDAKCSAQVTTRVESSGGHMGFVAARRTEFGDRRWLDAAVVDWVATASPRSAPGR
jgi:predicted alpha/beta-fold hydrolase